ncbi:predicted protein [Nematostella vectensis]|uniref:CN hydrolase domain-containing protein n=2 Tax=Nematostella vectensis TaxID=45351 RepID=A7RMU0_NEMVE|nr:predicted protein [Nematostella vectensis]|eukprot:XP_001639269.1 predicted protein [Nematostella vectensis]
MKSSKSSTIAICQMTCTADLEANFRQCQELIRKGSRKGAEVVFLPEGFDFLMKDKEKILELAEHLDGPRISKMCKLAEENGVWLSLGGFHCKHPSETRRVLNCHVVIDNKGRIAASYNKTHLFDVNIEGGPCLKESAFIAHGDRIVPPVSTPVGKLGLGICYDLRFPEFSMILARQGADILSFPSAFTFHTGSAHWEVLLRSRAIETQCYVVAAAQCGKLYEGREAYGHSMVVDPWGTVVAQCQDGIGLCMAEIDHQYIQKVRSGMPILSHRRVDLYGSLAAKERDME